MKLRLMLVGVLKLKTGLISVLSKMLSFSALKSESVVGSVQLTVSADCINKAGSTIKIKININIIISGANNKYTLIYSIVNMFVCNYLLMDKVS